MCGIRQSIAEMHESVSSPHAKISAMKSSMKTRDTTISGEALSDVVRREEEMKRCYRSRGLELRLNERVSVVTSRSFVMNTICLHFYE